MFFLLNVFSSNFSCLFVVLMFSSPVFEHWLSLFYFRFLFFPVFFFTFLLFSSFPACSLVNLLFFFFFFFVSRLYLLAAITVFFRFSSSSCVYVQPFVTFSFFFPCLCPLVLIIFFSPGLVISLHLFPLLSSTIFYHYLFFSSFPPFIFYFPFLRFSLFLSHLLSSFILYFWAVLFFIIIIALSSSFGFYFSILLLFLFTFFFLC